MNHVNSISSLWRGATSISDSIFGMGGGGKAARLVCVSHCWLQEPCTLISSTTKYTGLQKFGTHKIILGTSDSVKIFGERNDLILNVVKPACSL